MVQRRLGMRQTEVRRNTIQLKSITAITELVSQYPDEIVRSSVQVVEEVDLNRRYIDSPSDARREGVCGKGQSIIRRWVTGELSSTA